MSDFNSLVQYTVENISKPVKYIIYKLTEFIRVVNKFVFRQVPTGAASGYATIEQIEGNTVAWNQLISVADFNFPASVNAFKILKEGLNIPAGHKILFIWYQDTNLNSNTRNTPFVTDNGSKYMNTSENYHLSAGWYSWIYTVTSNLTHVRYWANVSNVSYNITNCQLIDLTAIFGAGNEPTTVADFEAWMAQNIGTLPYYDYNAGELISCKMQSVKSVGFNQWDEEWETGRINTNTGQNDTLTGIRSKNYIRVIHGQTYYCNAGSRGAVFALCYDVDKNFLKGIGTGGLNYIDIFNKTFIIPNNCTYIRWYSPSSPEVYNHDICINISDPAKNGTYEPYQSDSADIDVTTITGINTATNVREVIFADGMKQADQEGTVKDTLDLRSDTATVKCGIVDLGDSNWSYDSTYQLFSCRNLIYSKTKNTDKLLCIKYLPYTSSSLTMPDKTIGVFNANNYLYVKDTAYTDPTIFKNAMNGVKLIYELATPITYTDLQDANGNPLNPRYKVEQGGTEQVLPVNTSTPTTVAPTLSTIYKKNI